MASPHYPRLRLSVKRNAPPAPKKHKKPRRMPTPIHFHVELSGAPKEGMKGERITRIHATVPDIEDIGKVYEATMRLMEQDDVIRDAKALHKLKFDSDCKVCNADATEENLHSKDLHHRLGCKRGDDADMWGSEPLYFRDCDVCNRNVETTEEERYDHRIFGCASALRRSVQE